MATHAELASTYGRTIRYLRVSVTDRCNLRCTYCMPAGDAEWLPRTDLLTLDEIERVVRCAVNAGVVKVRLTGGEPLVRPGIVGLVARLRRLPGLRELVMTTNATHLARHAHDLAAAGLDRINISLDSLKPATFAAITRGGRLDDVLEGIFAADAAGLHPIKLNTVVQKGVNDDEIGDLALFALEHNWSIRFIEFMPIGCGAGEWAERFMPAEEILQRVKSAVGTLAPVQDGSLGPARTFKASFSAGSIGVINPMSNHFCGECTRLRLTADGRVRTCLLAEGQVDVRSLLRGGAADAAIQEALLQAAGMKPEWHGIALDGSGGKAPQRAMSQIGG